MPRNIYADWNGTTPIGQTAQTWMGKAIASWGNPSSIHQVGQAARGLLDEARAEIARVCERKPAEVVFTSGGSEANTMALWGSSLLKPGFKLLTLPVEHSSVRATCPMVTKQGGTVEKVKIQASGQLNWPDFVTKLEEFQPDLVSIMAANNETGVIYPLPEIIAECRARGVKVHTDAVQAFGKLPASFWNGADLISLSAHKILGPKGVGALLVSEGLQLQSTHFGGSQETKRRGGTENMVGIAGFAGACRELSPACQEKLGPWRDAFEAHLTSTLTDISILGRDTRRLGNTSKIWFGGISSEILLGALDLDGLFVSSGSACSSGSLMPSPVMLAMGLTEKEALECLRFSWGPNTTEDDVATAAQLVASHVTRIRERKKQ